MLLQEPTLDLPPQARVTVPGETIDPEADGVAPEGMRARASMLPIALESVLDTPFVGREPRDRASHARRPGQLPRRADRRRGRDRQDALRRGARSPRGVRPASPCSTGGASARSRCRTSRGSRCSSAWRSRRPPAGGPTGSRARPMLARLLPDLVTAAPERPDADPDAERYRLFEAVTDLIADAAAARGAVIVVDDLHWADEPTLMLLRHLLAVARPDRVLVVATYRDTDLVGASSLTETLADLRRAQGLEWLTLSGLVEGEVSELITALTEEHDVSKLARAVRDETDGNPFFVVEVVRHLTETGGLVDPGSAPGDVRDLPPSVREVVSQRVRALGVDVAEMLGTAAIVGVEFELDVLAAGPRSTRGDAGRLARRRGARPGPARGGSRPLRVRPRPRAVHAGRRRVRDPAPGPAPADRPGPRAVGGRGDPLGRDRGPPAPGGPGVTGSEGARVHAAGGDSCPHPARAARRVPVVHRGVARRRPGAGRRRPA